MLCVDEGDTSTSRQVILQLELSTFSVDVRNYILIVSPSPSHLPDFQDPYPPCSARITLAAHCRTTWRQFFHSPSSSPESILVLVTPSYSYGGP